MGMRVAKHELFNSNSAVSVDLDFDFVLAYEYLVKMKEFLDTMGDHADKLDSVMCRVCVCVWVCACICVCVRVGLQVLVMDGDACFAHRLPRVSHSLPPHITDRGSQHQDPVHRRLHERARL